MFYYIDSEKVKNYEKYLNIAVFLPIFRVISDSSKLRYACDHCDRRFRLKAWLQKHITLKHPGTVFIHS